MLLKIFKFLGLGILLIITIGGVVLGFVAYKEDRDKNAKMEADLAYMPIGGGWRWQDSYHGIQTRVWEGETQYRKVDRREGYVVYFDKDDDLSLSVYVQFFTECEPNTTIETSKKWRNGSPKKLVCSSDGSRLRHIFTVGASVFDQELYARPSYTENLDGFKYSIDLSDIDFTQRDKEITLSKAQKE